MKEFLFILKVKNNISIIPKKDILNELYYNLSIIPNIKELDYYILYNNLPIDDTKKYIKKLKKNISKLDNNLVLYDIKSKNIYLITDENVYYRVNINDYRLPTENLLKTFIKTLDKINLKSDLTNDEIYYKEKLIKNINFLSCFDLKVLKETYYKLFYKSSVIGKEITDCNKKSFNPNSNINPYYSTSELIHHALNMGLIQNKNIKLKQIYNLCNIIRANDFDNDIIFKHQIYIRENNIKHTIQYYTLYGSYFINNYLRLFNNNNNKNVIIKNPFIENIIVKFNNIIINSPPMNKAYSVYRFINSDHYMINYNEGEIFTSYSFTSTSRNPFFNPKDNYFGDVLIKINIPKNNKGLCLCVENYSLFPNEYEVILPPAKFKIINKNENFKYYHPNKEAQNIIKRKYELEIIETLTDTSLLFKNDKIKYFDKLPIIDLDTMNKYDIYNFYNKILIDINGMKPFIIIHNNKKRLFFAYYYKKSTIYNKFFYNSDNDFIYIVDHDTDNFKINLLIEITENLSINFHNRYYGLKYDYNNDFLDFIAKLAFIFNIDNVLIHPDYSSYYHIIYNDFDIDKQIKYLEEDNIDSHKLNLYTADNTFYCIDIYNYILLVINNDPFISKFKDYYVKNNLDLTFFKNLLDLNFNNINIPKLHPLYKLYYKKTFDNLLIYYIYIHDNYFYLIENLEHYILKYYNINNNIFYNMIYNFNYKYYLYSKELIETYFDYNNEINIYKNNIDIIDISKYNIEYNNKQMEHRIDYIQIK